MAKRRRPKAPKPGRHPMTGERPGDLDSATLRRRLVEDATAGRATPPEWFLAAVTRIARLDGLSLDGAYLQVRQEVASLGGVMPEAPGS